MIRIKGRGAVYGEVWFDEEPDGDSGVDIVTYRHRGDPVPGARTEPRLSLVNDLTLAEDAIVSGFDKDCRYEIRRADTKDALAMEFIAQPGHRLEQFRAFYDAFAAEKSLKPCYWQWLVAACDARQLTLTCASKDGEPLVWHAYVTCGTTAQLEYSASCYRHKESAYRALVGRANRWLHWKDMLRFKALGYTRYDFGGLFEDETTAERAGINRFKRAFGGREQRVYDCTLPVTSKGRIWLPLRAAWERRKSVLAGMAVPAASG